MSDFPFVPDIQSIEETPDVHYDLDTGGRPYFLIVFNGNMTEDINVSAQFEGLDNEEKWAGVRYVLSQLAFAI